MVSKKMLVFKKNLEKITDFFISTQTPKLLNEFEEN
jgi:hypothetical protein